MSRKAKEPETDEVPSSAELLSAAKPPSRAARATGPKTPAGKRRSSQNAAKHRLFSKTGFPSNVQWGKLPTEYRKLYRDLVKDLKPEGARELIAVEAIASCFYRWRAAAYLQIELVTQLRLDVPRETSIPKEVRDEVIRQYLNSLPAKSRMGILLGFPRPPGLKLPPGVPLWDMLPDPTEPSPCGEELTPEELAARVRDHEDTRAFIRQLEEVGEIIESMKPQSKSPDIQMDPALRLREENRRMELLNEQLDKWQRYEAHFWRIFQRALNEFERLQRMRLGQPVAPPIQVNLTT